MTADALVKDAADRMSQAVEVFSQNLQAMRTGRPAPELIEDLPISCYNTSMPLKQVASISVEEGRSLTVQVFDREIVEDVDRGIRQSPLDLNPQISGNMLRIVMPPLSEEMRQNLVRQTRADAEKARVAVRNVRRDCLTKIRAGDSAEDEVRGFQAQVQKNTDDNIAQIDALLKSKESSLLGH